MADVMTKAIYQGQLRTVRRVGVATDWTGGVNFNIFTVANAWVLRQRIPAENKALRMLDGASVGDR